MRWGSRASPRRNGRRPVGCPIARRRNCASSFGSATGCARTLVTGSGNCTVLWTSGFRSSPAMCAISGASWRPGCFREYPTAAGFHGVPVRRVAALRYDGRHKVGEDLAAALIAAAAGSVGRHHGEAYRIQVRYTCEDLDVLRRRLRDLERDIDRLLEQHEIGRLQTTARLVATFGDFSSFPSAGALASYVGAVPALKQSGTRTFQRASLTPIGAARLRAKLWMPVLTAVRTNP